MLLEACPFLLDCQICWYISVHNIFFLYSYSIGCYFSFFTSYFVDLDSLSFFSWWVWSEVCQFFLPFQRISSWFIDFFFCFFNLYFIYSLLNLYYFLSSSDLGFVGSPFSNSFRWWVRLFDYFFSFLMKACITMNFLIRTAFYASHRFCIPVCQCLKVCFYFFFNFIVNALVFY